MTESDVRWIQRFRHFQLALVQLREAVALSKQRPLSRLEGQGVIQAFEFSHELAWNTLKDFLESRGAEKLYGSKDSTREAFKKGLIVEGDVWMDMVKSRNLTTHTYNEAVAAKILAAVMESYFPEFETLERTLEKLTREAP